MAGFVILLAASLLIFAVVSWLEGNVGAWRDPGAWLADLDREGALETLSNAAEVVAGVLAIAITVVAIVVELAANAVQCIYNMRHGFPFATWGECAFMTVQCKLQVLMYWWFKKPAPNLAARAALAGLYVATMLASFFPFARPP